MELKLILKINSFYELCFTVPRAFANVIPARTLCCKHDSPGASRKLSGC